MAIEHATAHKEQAIKRQRDATSAAYTYFNLHWMTTAGLSKSFNVSENTITKWLCEAVAKRYIPSDDMCQAIMQKHIAEYERLHSLHNSSLRGMYREAFDARSRAPRKIIQEIATA